jgi:hypothetical protein
MGRAKPDEDENRQEGRGKAAHDAASRILGFYTLPASLQGMVASEPLKAELPLGTEEGGGWEAALPGVPLGSFFFWDSPK